MSEKVLLIVHQVQSNPGRVAAKLAERGLEIAREVDRRDTGFHDSTASLQMILRNSAAPHPMAAHQTDSLAMFYTSIGDGKEGVAAFLGKRKAEFRSKASTDMPPFYPWW